MHDAKSMRRVQRVRDLNCERQRLIEWKWCPGETSGERLTFEVLHHEKVNAVVMTHVMNGADVLVIERGDRARFSIESGAGRGISTDIRGQHLYGHGAVEATVARAIHLTHTACPERGDDFVRSYPCTGNKSHEIRIFQE